MALEESMGWYAAPNPDLALKLPGLFFFLISVKFIPKCKCRHCHFVNAPRRLGPGAGDEILPQTGGWAARTVRLHEPQCSVGNAGPYMDRMWGGTLESHTHWPGWGGGGQGSFIHKKGLWFLQKNRRPSQNCQRRRETRSKEWRKWTRRPEQFRAHEMWLRTARMTLSLRLGHSVSDHHHKPPRPKKNPESLRQPETLREETP